MRDGLRRIEAVAVIGGTSDIGLAIARKLTTIGARRLVLAGRDMESIRSAAGDLPVGDVVHLDVGATDPSEAVGAVFSGGDIDVVVMAAGVLHTDPDSEEIADMAVVNGAGSVLVLSELARAMEQQGHGHLVVLSTVAVARPRPSNYWYGSSKAALDFAARGLGYEMRESGIRVTVVRPGFVHSKMTQGMDGAPFAVQPEVVAAAVVKAVQQGTEGVVYVPGALRWVFLLLQWLPMSLVRRLDR